MSTVFVSPGVYTQEIDESFLPAGAGSIGAAIVGLTKKGPAFLPVQVSNMSEFRQVFGDPDSKLGYVGHAAKSYLRNASALNVVRTLGRGTAQFGGSVYLAFPNGSGVSAGSAGLGFKTTTSGNTLLGVLKRRGTDTSDVSISGTPTNFAILYGTTADATSALLTGLSLSESSPAYIKKVLGTNPLKAEPARDDSLSSLYVDAVFDYQVGQVLGTASGFGGGGANGIFVSATGLENAPQITDNHGAQIGGFSPANSPMILSQNYLGTTHNLFQFFTRSDGEAANFSVKVSISQVDTTSTAFPEFTVLVRAGDDSDEQPVVIEQFSNVNLDHSSDKFIGRMIGDRRPVYDLTQDPPEILFDGDFPNRSRYVRVQVEDSYPVDARPSGYGRIPKINPASISGNGSHTSVSGVPSLPLKSNHLNSRSSLDSRIFLGVDFTVGGLKDRLKSTIVSASGSTTSDNQVIIISTTADLTGSGNLNNTTFIDLLGSTSAANVQTTNKLRFTVPVFGGKDGLDPRVDKLLSLNDGTLSADILKASKTLSNPDEIDFNLLAVPGVWSGGTGNVPGHMIDLVESRADAFYIMDIASSTTTASGLSLQPSAAVSEADKYDSSYAATYYPWLRINDAESNRLLWVPPSVEVLGAYAYNDRVGQAWFAPAGFNRGGLENVLEARKRLTSSQRDELYIGRVNPIATFPQQGVVIFGQKTLQKKETLLSRVNVRRLLITTRKTIAGFSKLFVFEQNTVTLRSRLLNIINDYLTDVQNANGLTEFRAIIDETTTTPDLIDRNQIAGKIFLRPTPAVEVITLDFVVTRNGASFNE